MLVRRRGRRTWIQREAAQLLALTAFSHRRGSVRQTDGVRDVVLLGSTGSIGTQALDVVTEHPGQFRVVGLAAGGSSIALLAQQVLDTGARTVGLSRATSVQDLQLALYAEASKRGWASGDLRLPQILAGPDAGRGPACPATSCSTGSPVPADSPSTLAALEAGSILALANKESLVIGGPLVTSAAARVRSSPSTQNTRASASRRGGAEVDRLILTASGGPSAGVLGPDGRRHAGRGTGSPDLAHGAMVTTNSATRSTRGWSYSRRTCCIAYRSTGSTWSCTRDRALMVQFVDGSTLAQCSPPDMKLPIAPGLSWPERLPAVAPPCDWTTAASWTFEPLDNDAFPAVELARSAGLSVAPRRQCSTQPTRNASTHFMTAGSAFWTFRAWWSGS